MDVVPVGPSFSTLRRTRVLHAVAISLAAYAPLALPQTQDKELGEVKVQGQQQRELKPKLRDEIIATETFGPRDIEKVQAGNINEAIDRNPGISVQTECAICNVRNVTLNNLPGRFTTLLIDGIPIYSSVSSAYGLDSVGVVGLERIEVSRGAATSLIAPEALSGVVNLVTKRPSRPERVGVFSLGNFGSARLDTYLGQPLDGGAFSLTLNANQHNSVDGNGDRISEFSGYRRGIAGLAYMIDNLGGFSVRGRLDAITERRGGGSLGRDYADIKRDDAGNPFNWSAGPNGSPDPRGWVVPDGSGPDTLANGQSGFLYDGGRAGFSEIIFTDRFQTTVSGERGLGTGGRLRLAGALAQHKQDSFYEKSIYRANQTQWYLESSVRQPLGQNLLTAGLSYRFEDLKSVGEPVGQDALTAGSVRLPAVSDIDGYAYHTPGLFLQAYRALFGGGLELNGSVRFDWHKDRGPNPSSFGRIISPRFTALWHHSTAWSSRFALGKGYRAPTSFFEQDHGILDTVLIEKRITEPEISHNASYALSYAGDRQAMVATANYNRLKNVALLDPNKCRPVAGGALTDSPCGPGEEKVTLFTSAQKPITVKGVDVSWTYRVTPALTSTLAAERFWYDLDPTEQTLTFVRPEKRAYLTLDYESGPWDGFFRVVWTGSQDLFKFYNQYGQRFHFDGTPKADRAPAFAWVDLRIAYRFDKRWSAFAGADNLFDYRQVRRDSPLWIDASGAPDVTHIWGPLRGRFLFAGVRADI